MYSYLKPLDVGSDVEDFEEDNIPIALYVKKEGGEQEISGSTTNKNARLQMRLKVTDIKPASQQSNKNVSPKSFLCTPRA